MLQQRKSNFYVGSLPHVSSFVHHNDKATWFIVPCHVLNIPILFRAGLFVGGPESAGAHPGPVCYRKGGPLTITDANLLLGRLLPNYFPKIFGPGENEALDKSGTSESFKALAEEVNK